MKSRVLAWSTGVATAVTSVVMITAPPAHAADFVAGPGTYLVDTTTLTISGPGGGVVGTDVGGVAVFSFDNVAILSGATLNVSGTRPFRLQASGTMNIAGTINASGGSATDFVSTPPMGGPGGGTGGAAGPGTTGGGPGGGRSYVSSGNNGGGGGGYGGRGAVGGIQTPPETGGQGGAANGDLPSALDGSSGGGGGAAVAGGAGGGAVDLRAQSLTLGSGGVVFADGGGGAVGGGGASGGGSGGAIRLDADDLSISGILVARGGPGGIGACCGDGGGGGGGRIALLYDGSLSLAGTQLMTGGASGTRSTSGFSSGSFHSVDPTGLPGVLTITAGTALAAGSDQTATYGQQVTLSTRLTQQAGGTGVGGVPVSLYSRANAGSTWQLVGTWTTAADGGAATTLKATLSTQYEWRFGGNPSRQATSSAVWSVGVMPKLKAKVLDKTVRQGATVLIHGSAKPVGKGQKVRLERKQGSKWVKVATTKIKKQKVPGSTKKTVIFVFSLKATAKGGQTYRVVKPAAAGLAEGVSKTVTVKVS